MNIKLWHSATVVQLKGYIFYRRWLVMKKNMMMFGIKNDGITKILQIK